MSKWEVYEWKKSSTPLDSDWLVRELATDGTLIDVIMNCGFGEPAEDLARRIAKLPELEAIVAKLPELEAIVAKLPELEAIVAKLPKTADGVYWIPGEDVTLYHPQEAGSQDDVEIEDGHWVAVWWVVDRDSGGSICRYYEIEACYSTPEAAEAAEAAGEEVGS